MLLMLSLKKMSQGIEDYYLDLSKYYVGDGPNTDGSPRLASPSLSLQPDGVWMGRGAAALGLQGRVSPHDLRKVFQGMHPVTGTALVQNAGSVRRCPGWDATFSDPKDVSVLWSEAPADVRAQIENARHAALGSTLRFAEDHVTFSRVGKGGTGFVRVGIVAAAFADATSRNLDPQQHWHTLLINIGVDKEGITRALDSRPLYNNKLLLGAFYRASLAYELSQTLGLSITGQPTGFRIEGIPADLSKAASTRRNEISAWLEQHGRSGAVAAAGAALATRNAKQPQPPPAELFQVWHERNVAHGFNWDDFARNYTGLRTKADELTEQSTREATAAAIDAAIRRLSASKAHFTKTDFLTAVLCEAPERRLEPVGLLKTASQFIQEQPEVLAKPAIGLVPLGVHERQSRFTTPDVIAEERKLIAALDNLKASKGAVVSPPVVEQAITARMHAFSKTLAKQGKKTAKEPKLSDEQLAAVRHLTEDTLGSGAIRVVRGLAGTGKTKIVLQTAHQAWKKAGYRVIAATPTATAGRVLQTRCPVNYVKAGSDRAEERTPRACAPIEVAGPGRHAVGAGRNRLCRYAQFARFDSLRRATEREGDRGAEQGDAFRVMHRQATAGRTMGRPVLVGGD